MGPITCLPVKSINILDCTLRNDGYYNNWNFTREIVNVILIDMVNLKIFFYNIKNA